MILVRQLVLALLLACLFPPVASEAETNVVYLRVVSLAPSLTELVCALGLGDHLVGRSSACDYPPSVCQLSVAGGFGRPQLEMVENLKPDVVLATDVEKPGALHRLEKMGVRVLILPCEGWTDLMSAAREISRELGQSVRGEEWVKDMETRRDALSSKTAKYFVGREKPRVYVEVWGDPLTTVSGTTFVHDLVGLAGGHNIAEGLKGRYVHISSEWVIREDPDVILLAYMLPGMAVPERLARRPGWDRIRAVQSGKVCTTIPPDWLLRPGPRMIEGAEAFADWLMQHSP